MWIGGQVKVSTYKSVTPRNGKYSAEMLKRKLEFEEQFAKLCIFRSCGRTGTLALSAAPQSLPRMWYNVTIHHQGKGTAGMPIEKRYSPEDIIEMMKAQFGNAVKAHWFYDGDFCPCCLSRPIDEMVYDNQKALSINAFMYRERGVLIAYLLCGQCAQEILGQSPKEPTSTHKAIEDNLVNAYLGYVNSLT